MAAAPRRSKYHWLYEMLKHGELRLAVTTDILEEYEEQLSDFYSPEFAEYVLKTIINLPDLEEVIVHFKWRLITSDPDDDKFVDAAVASNVDYIITHDRHFRLLDSIDFPKVKHISMRDFYLLHFGVPMPE
jgi:predicted nucleic acid-binding protein